MLPTSTWNLVSCRGSPPSSRIVHACCEPPRFETNAIVPPSGDHIGPLSVTCLADVSCLRLLPSMDTSHKLVVFLFASLSHVRRVKTIHFPSGDGVGSARRSIDTMS